MRPSMSLDSWLTLTHLKTTPKGKRVSRLIISDGRKPSTPKSERKSTNHQGSTWPWVTTRVRRATPTLSTLPLLVQTLTTHYQATTATYHARFRNHDIPAAVHTKSYRLSLSTNPNHSSHTNRPTVNQATLMQFGHRSHHPFQEPRHHRLSPYRRTGTQASENPHRKANAGQPIAQAVAYDMEHRQRPNFHPSATDDSPPPFFRSGTVASSTAQ